MAVLLPITGHVARESDPDASIVETAVRDARLEGRKDRRVEVAGAEEALFAADLVHAVGRVGEGLALVGRAELDVVEAFARVGCAVAGPRAAKGWVGVGDVGDEGGVRVAVGAEGVVDADVAWVRDGGATG